MSPILLPKIAGAGGPGQASSDVRDFCSIPKVAQIFVICSKEAENFETGSKSCMKRQSLRGMTACPHGKDIRPAPVAPVSPQPESMSPRRGIAARSHQKFRGNMISPKSRLLLMSSIAKPPTHSPRSTFSRKSPRKIRPAFGTPMVVAPPEALASVLSRVTSLRCGLLAGAMQVPRLCKDMQVDLAAAPVPAASRAPPSRRRLRSITVLSASSGTSSTIACSIPVSPLPNVEERAKCCCMLAEGSDAEDDTPTDATDIVLNGQEFVPRRALRSIPEAKAAMVALTSTRPTRASRPGGVLG